MLRPDPDPNPDRAVRSRTFCPLSDCQAHPAMPFLYILGPFLMDPPPADPTRPRHSTQAAHTPPSRPGATPPTPPTDPTRPTPGPGRSGKSYSGGGSPWGRSLGGGDGGLGWAKRTAVRSPCLGWFGVFGGFGGPCLYGFWAGVGGWKSKHDEKKGL